MFMYHYENNIMKKTTQQILANCEKGIFTVVRNKKDNQFRVRTPIKDSYGNFRDSCWCNIIEEAKRFAGVYYGYSLEELDKMDLEIVEEYRIIGEPFKVGDKVRILDSIKETDYWKDFKDAVPEMKGEIEVAYNLKDGLYYRVNGWVIDHQYLAPLVEEQCINKGDEIEVCIKGKKFKAKII